MTFYSFFILVAAIFVCGIIAEGFQATHYPDVYFVDANCESHIQVSGDIVVRLSNNTMNTESLDCTVYFESADSNNLIVTFLNYSIDPNYVNEFGECYFLSIQLFDRTTTPLLSSGDQYCSQEMPSQRYNLSQLGSLTFSVSDPPTKTPDIQILISQVLVKGPDGCIDGYFDCEVNSSCVMDNITCNGFNDCGNDADEVGCTAQNTSTITTASTINTTHTGNTTGTITTASTINTTHTGNTTSTITTASTISTTPTGDSSNNAGMIVGIIFGVSLAIAGIILIIVLYSRRRRLFGKYERA